VIVTCRPSIGGSFNLAAPAAAMTQPRAQKENKKGADLSAPIFGLACNAPAKRRHVTPSSDAGT